MECTRRASSILLMTGITLIIQLLVTTHVLAQDTNTTSQNRSTIKIIDPKNHTITIIDTKTNQPISVSKYTPEDVNKTTSDTLTTNSVNTTTSEILTPEKPAINGTVTPNTENVTTAVNLTDKFDDLQGK